MELREQRLDPRRVCNTLVQLERDLRRETKAKRTTDARPEMARDARETVERRRALRIAAENADEHFGVAKIASNVDTGNSHEADDARILYAFCQEGRHFFTNRFSDPVRATGIVRHVLQNPSLNQRHRVVVPRGGLGAHAAPKTGARCREKQK